MNASLVELLRCTRCGGSIDLSEQPLGEPEGGSLRCVSCHTVFPVVRGIPRFVPSENYAGNFGLQWNTFRTTQLDSHSGTTISRDRFLGSTGWSEADLRGRRVLDVGCGAGRFAEVALSLGAEVVAVDYSSAVDATLENLGHHPRLRVIQADIFKLPFAPESFDFVYCLGVLQHTPDVGAAFRALPRMVRPGGGLAVDLYPRLLRNLLTGKYWVRPITRRMARDRLFRICRRAVPMLLPISLQLGRVPFFGRQLRKVLPISNYEGVHPLSPDQLREWALLDTYDMLAPVHDHPQTARTLLRWFSEHPELAHVEVFRQGHLVGRAMKRRTAAGVAEGVHT
jgi:SAM-dependent methyltransferase